MLVKGRHLGMQQFRSDNIESDFHVYPDGVTLRLDDKVHLEWWLEVDIPKEKLEELLERVKNAT